MIFYPPQSLYPHRITEKTTFLENIHFPKLYFPNLCTSTHEMSVRTTKMPRIPPYSHAAVLTYFPDNSKENPQKHPEFPFSPLKAYNLSIRTQKCPKSPINAQKRAI